MSEGETRRPSATAFSAPKGTRDVLPPESDRWQEIVARFSSRARRFGFGLVVTPIFEHYEVFARLGDSTDVVSKEMYDFLDKGDRRLALRPEGTAGVVRAYVQHRPTPPWKVWYVAPNFRYEQPQAGRYRQHFQLGAEAVGTDDPAVDVEMIDLLGGFYSELGLRDVRLVINSMGDGASRDAYQTTLVDYWSDHAAELGSDLERAQRNPLRILDSKRQDWAAMIDAAPRLADYLSDASLAHFSAVQDGLRAIGIGFEIEHRLVRGFDYYTGTVFEFRSGSLSAGQDTIGGGGRYDRLSEAMGGPPAPAIGFGTGVERILIVADADGALSATTAPLDVFVIDATGGDRASEITALTHDLREFGFSVDRAFGGRSVKKQWGVADKRAATYAVMVAPREWEAGAVVVKELSSGEQVDVPRTELADWLRVHSRNALA